ncbi:MAG: DUF5050 domain-containing protein [Caldisericia bacterium]|nr:DUF5050 domain-containing protein [Caldisericia bacterium]
MKHSNKLLTTLVLAVMTVNCFSCTAKKLGSQNKNEEFVIKRNNSQQTCDLVCFNTGRSKAILNGDCVYYRKKITEKNKKTNSLYSSNNLFKRNVNESNEVLLMTHINPFKITIHEDTIYCIDDSFGDCSYGTLLKISSDGSNYRSLSREKVLDFVIHKGWIYYIDPFKNNCKKIKLNGSEKTLLIAHKNIKSLLFYNDTMYLLISRKDTQFPEKPYDLYSFSEEDKTLTLEKSSINDIKLYKNHAYYINSNDSLIYRYNIETLITEKLSNKTANYMKIEDNYIYFQTEKCRVPEKYAFCRMKLDGSNQKEIYDCKKTSLMYLYKDNLYFVKENNLLEINPDGNKTVLRKIPMGISIQSISSGVLFYLYTKKDAKNHLSSLGFCNLND